MKPWPAVIFAVDPGAKPGWSYWWDGKLLTHGIGNLLNPAMAVAYDTSGNMKAPFILVIEKHRPQGKWGHKAAVGLERSVGEVTGEAKRIGIPKSRVHRVFPEDWRRPVLGRTRMGGAAWKRRAMLRVKADFGVDVGDDEAEAILIGYWATLAPELLPYMPKKVRDAWGK